METKQPSATITSAERMKLIKWAKKNGAARICIDGVSLEFDRAPVSEIPVPALDAKEDFAARIQTIRDFATPVTVPRQSSPMYSQASDSTESAVSALRSRLEDPEAFARQTDAWANQTRLPRE